MYLAYLDPGSGSMLAAAVVAGFAGAVVAVRVWWRRLRSKLMRRPAGATAAASTGGAGAGATAEPVVEGGTAAGRETSGAGGNQTGIGATPTNATADFDRDR